MEKEKSQIKIGAVLGYLNIIIGNLIPFFYTPVMLKLLGQDEHGLYKLANNVASYLSLATFGIGAAVTRYLIKARVEKGKEAEERMFGLFNLFFWGIAAVTLVAGVVLSFNIDLFYEKSLNAEELKRMTILLLIITVNTAVGFSSAAYNAVVSSHERFFFLQIVNLFTTCIVPVANLVALYMGYASIGMTISSLIVTVIIRIMYLIYVRKALGLKPRYDNMPTDNIKEILLFSFWVFVGTVVNQLYSATDTVIIGAIPELAAAAVSVYSVGTVFSHIVSSLAQTISNLMTPKANKMVFGGASDKELSDFVISVGRYQFLLIALVCSGFVAFGQPFIEWYAGENYVEAYWVAVFIMIPSCIPLIQSVALSIVTAQNRHKFRSLVYLFIAVFNAITTYFAVRTMGITGAALMTGIAYIIGPGFIMNWFYRKKMNLDVFRFWREILKMLWIPVLMCVGTLFLGKVFDFHKLSTLFIGIGVYTLVYCVLMFFIAMKKEERTAVYSYIRKFTGKKKVTAVSAEENKASDK